MGARPLVQRGEKRMNNDICKAIENKNVIEFFYNGQRRVIEPYCYGIHKDTGNEVLRAYQIGGFSSSGKIYEWKLYIVSKMSGIVVLDKRFKNPRPSYKMNDSTMATIFCQIQT